jgi:hypothetical protein
MGVENEDGTVIGGNGAVIDRNGRVDCDPNVQIATRVGPNDGGAPGSVEEALRMAVVLAVRAGEYERAGEVLEMLRRGRKAATVAQLDVVRSR